MRKKLFCMLLLSGFALSTVQAAPELNIFGTPNPSTLCMTSTIDGVSLCKEGELMFFSPSRFGNEQFPLVVISFNCDTSKPIFFNTSGVICFKNAGPRLPIDPEYRNKAERWNAFRNSVIRPGSGWVQQSDTIWIKVVKSGSGELPPPNTKIALGVQHLNVSEEKEGKPYNSDLETTEDSNYILQKFPLGTVLRMFVVKEIIADSILTEYTIKSFTPIKEKKKANQQPQPKKEKPTKKQAKPA